LAQAVPLRGRWPFILRKAPGTPLRRAWCTAMNAFRVVFTISAQFGIYVEGAIPKKLTSGRSPIALTKEGAIDNVTLSQRHNGLRKDPGANFTVNTAVTEIQFAETGHHQRAQALLDRKGRIPMSENSGQFVIELARLGSSYDFLPRDFLSHVSDLSDPHSQAVLLYLSVLSVLGVLLGAIYGGRGVAVCLAIQCYVFSLSIMTLLIRMVFVTYRFPYAQWVTATHFLMTAIVSFCKLWLQRQSTGASLRIPDSFTLCVGVLPVGFVFAASIAFSNQALVHSNAHFFEMFNSLGLLVTAGLGVLLGRPIGWPLVPPLLALTAGLLVVSFGEVSCSWMGIVLIFLGMGFRAAKAQLQALLLAGNNGFKKFEPTELVLWSSAACFFVLVPWSLITEGYEPFIRCTETGVLPAVFLGMVNACFLNIAGLYVLKELGPVAQQAVGNFKSILACLSAVVAFSEVITMQQVLGYGIIICSCMWYNRVDMRAKAAQQQDDARATQKPLWVKAEAPYANRVNSESVA